MADLSVYIPMDRRHSLATGVPIPERLSGAVLFADISGFTPLTEALARELGAKRGAEELTRHLDHVYDALIAELHRYGGSVISFSGDAITCWLDGDDGRRATACGLAMQAAMQQFSEVHTAGGAVVSLGMKVAVAVGNVRRFLVGDPIYAINDAMAGVTLEHVAAAEHLAHRGDVILALSAAEALEGLLEIAEWRQKEETGERFAVVTGLKVTVPERPWPELAPDALSDEQISAWLLPSVDASLRGRQQIFRAELRPAVALFARFGGIDYDGDEEAPARLDAFIRQVEYVAGRYDGNLLQLTIGDKGSYFYMAFGAPIAHEDDVARALSTALELSALPAQFPTIEPIQIGVSEGRMRVGASGSQTRRTYGVHGDAANLAARLMQAAPPGQIYVQEAARQAGRDGFTWESLPPFRVKGKSELITASRLVGRAGQRDTHLLEPQYSLPMVGRQSELAVVSARIDDVVAGRGQIVGITAEAGMGKSRLAAEVVRVARERAMARYAGECQSFGTNTSYLVWQRIWRGLFGLDASDPLETQMARLETALAVVDPALARRTPLLSSVVNLPIPDTDLTRPFDAKLRKSSLEALLVDFLRARAAQGPMLLVLEDTHWLDSLSADLLEVIGRAIMDLPVLILLVYRPSDLTARQTSSIRQLPYFSEIELKEFSSQEAEQLITLKLAQFFGADIHVSTSFVERITDRAAGNPFYIEELLNYLRDQSIGPADTQALAEMDLPDSLYGLILSRVDKLTEQQKSIIKVASVIGRLFAAAMVWGVYPALGTLEAVLQDLGALSRLDLTTLDTPEPEMTYLFKHVITQEVAYESLLYATRATLHEQIGRFIERGHADKLDRFIDLLAFHYDRSENADKKREYLLKAGEAAQSGYANQSALDYYRRVLPLLAPEDKVEVFRKLGQVLELIAEWEKAQQAYEEGLALAESLGDERGAAWCQTAMGELMRKRNQYGEAATWFERAYDTFERIGDKTGLGQVLHYNGTLHAQQGKYDEAHASYTASLELRRQTGDRANFANVLSNLGIVARYQGKPEQARDFYLQSLAIREELGDRWAIAVSLNNLGHMAVDQGDYANARTQLQRALSIWIEIGERWAAANTLHNLANLARDEGRTEEAMDFYRQSIRIMSELNDRWAIAYWLEDVACLRAERDGALTFRLLGAAAALRQQIGASYPPSYLKRLEDALAPTRERLGIERAEAARDKGLGLAQEAAISLALAGDGEQLDGHAVEL